jgi:AcrR family transcriptional regulator
MSRRPFSQQAQHAQTRLQLFDAMLRQIAARGLDTTGIADVTRAAGLPLEAFYANFPNKSVMFIELLQHLQSVERAAFEELAALHTDSSSWHEQFLTLFHTLQRNRLSTLCQTEARLLAARDPDFRAWFSAFNRQIILLIADRIREICTQTRRQTTFPPEQIARGLMSLVEGMQLGQCSDDDTTVTQHFVARFIETMTCEVSA